VPGLGLLEISRHCKNQPETFPLRLTAKPASAITPLPNKGRAAGSGTAEAAVSEPESGRGRRQRCRASSAGPARISCLICGDGRFLRRFHFRVASPHEFPVGGRWGNIRRRKTRYLADAERIPRLHRWGDRL